ncbi:MAG: hypothetical protein GY772_10275, partial [bacterium]|nr:hypothetical protein [bacterium]
RDRVPRGAAVAEQGGRPAGREGGSAEQGQGRDHRGQRTLAQSLRRWAQNNPEDELAERYRFACRSGKRAALTRMITEWQRDPRCTSRVSRTASVTEEVSDESGCLTKSWAELVQQFGEEGAELRAKVYKSVPDPGLSEGGLDCSSRENRWYLVPFKRSVESTSCKRSLETEMISGGPATSTTLTQGAVEVEVLRRLEGSGAVEEHLRGMEEQAEKGELQPRAPKSKARATPKSKGGQAMSQEVKKELRRALTKQQGVASKLLERRAKLERNDAALWGGIVKKIQ